MHLLVEKNCDKRFPQQQSKMPYLKKTGADGEINPNQQHKPDHRRPPDKAAQQAVQVSKCPKKSLH